MLNLKKSVFQQGDSWSWWPYIYKGKWSAKIMILISFKLKSVKSHTDHECPTVSLDVQHQTGKYLIQHLYRFQQ